MWLYSCVCKTSLSSRSLIHLLLSAPSMLNISKVRAETLRFGFLQDKNLPPPQRASSSLNRYFLGWSPAWKTLRSLPSPPRFFSLCLLAVAWRKLSGCGRAPEFPPLHGPMSSGDGRATATHNNFQSQFPPNPAVYYPAEPPRSESRFSSCKRLGNVAHRKNK